MLLTSVYFANLLCSFYNCQHLQPPPVQPSNTLSVDRIGRSFVSPPDPIVNTTQGQVEGYLMGVFKRKIYAFEGIPYAEPPVGNLRFRDPVPKSPWNGVRSAKKQSAECLQFNLPRFLRVVGTEGCLELNISTHEHHPKLPVLIYIHGGSFIFGRASDYGPAYLLQENIVLVTIGFRLGVLGFLSTGDEEAPGNYGLKDQALAIEWVYKNIEQFGGDNSRITLSGQSAGAACVHLHMISSSISKGYFRNAISLSGSAAHHWALHTPQHARQLTQNFAKRLGCPVDRGSKPMMDCLRRIEPNFLVAAQNNLIEYLGFPVVLFRPVIEPNVTGAFITESVEDAYRNGHVAKIPYLCTNTAEEGEYILMAMKNFLVAGHVIRNWETRGPLILDLKDYVDDPGRAVMEIRDVYLRDMPPQQRIAVIDSNVKRYAQMGTDRYFTLGNRRALKFHADVGPTYSYIFRYRSRLGVAKFLATDYKEWGASHGEDLTILFNNTAMSPPMNMEEATYEVSRKLISLIANFVSHNVPYITTSNGSLAENWKTIGDPDYPKFLEIAQDGRMKMIPDPMHGTEEFNVWGRLGIK